MNYKEPGEALLARRVCRSF